MYRYYFVLSEKSVIFLLEKVAIGLTYGECSADRWDAMLKVLFALEKTFVIVVGQGRYHHHPIVIRNFVVDEFLAESSILTNSPWVFIDES